MSGRQTSTGGRSATRGASGSSRSELAAALAACRSALAGVALLSGASNVLMLTGAFFMLEVYDRVLPSRSMPTLIGLVALAGLLYLFLGLIDMVRGRLLARVGQSINESLDGRVYDVLVQLPLKVGGANDGMQPLRDLESIRSFLSGQGPIALFDLPWMPLYVGICFILHPWIGVAALGGAILLVALTVVTELVVRAPTRSATQLAAESRVLADTSRRNADVIVAMGMAAPLQRRWRELNARYLSAQQKASDLAGGLGATARMLRMMLQSGVLAVGAWLVIQDQATAGIIIAGSILAARALAPVDLAITHWRAFVAARQARTRLSALLGSLPAARDPMSLPRPTAMLSVDTATAIPPGAKKIVLQDVSFALSAGSGLGIIGPSASGKSSLLKLLVGAWQPARGKICLDGAALDQWSASALGRHIGYLPQEVELLAGTVAENISRFEVEPDPDAIVAAARAAGCHELITGLSEGYETEIGEQGASLSAGQRQWIALARALYRDPFLVVLDEPNSNLDSTGEEALTRAMLGVRQRGGVLVVVAHRPSALAAVDLTLVMGQGRVQAFGPRDEVLGRVLRRDATRPFKVVSEPTAVGS